MGREEETKMVTRVSVVSDYQDMLDMLHVGLMLNGYEVEAIMINDYRFLKERYVPDLIIIDVFEQEEKGERLCRQLKNNEQSRGIPLLFLSNHRSKKQAFNLTHATDFLCKPFRLSDLFCMVQKYTSTG